MGNNLADRVGQHPNAVSRKLTAVDAVLPHTVSAPDVAPGEPPVEKSLEEHLRDHLPMFRDAMPRGGDVDQLVQDAVIALRKVRNLDRCDHYSLLGAVMTAAQLGLRIGVLGHSWLEPIWQRRYARNERGRWVGQHRARLIIGYQGLRELAMRSDKVRDIVGRAVGAREHFVIAYGLDDKLEHEPCKEGLPGDSVAYYVIVRQTNGGRVVEHFTRAQAEEHRDKYASQRRKNHTTGEWVITGAWETHFDDMAIKSVFRKASRWVPKSTALHAALEVDGAVRVDLTAEGILHADRPDALNANLPGLDHDGGHGEGLAWSFECEECVDDADGETHFLDHATAAPIEGCAYCEQEAAWRGLPVGTRA